MERLGVTEKGLYKHKGVLLSYDHILPKQLEKLNIIETIRKEFWEYFNTVNSNFKLDTGFHHLNSSQALCFNLFYPFIYSREYDSLLLRALEIQIGVFTELDFEKVIDSEENTNFDFYISSNSGSIFFELKYKEDKFGACKPDAHHKEKYVEIYKPLMDGVITPEYQKPSVFFKYYQIVRNLLYLQHNDGNRLVFIFPKENDAINKQKEHIFEAVTDEYRNSVSYIYLEDLIDSLLMMFNTENHYLFTHFTLFKEKYIPY